MQPQPLPADTAPARAGAWYRQPVLWLGAAILAASLAGCVWMIVLGSRHADVPLEDVRPHTLLDMPMHGTGLQKAEAGAGAPLSPPRGAEGVAEHGP